MDKIRIALVDDHALIRQGVSLFLSREPDFDVVGEAGDVAGAVKMLSDADPDVVLMDVTLGNELSLDLTRRLKTTRPNLRVLVVTAHADESVVAGMIDAGADGYVLKDMAMAELAQAVRAVAVGQFVLHPSVARRWTSAAPRASAPRADDDLTPRELEVLQYMVDGATSKEIARRLSLSIKTVENHRANILGKLQARNAAEAVSRAIERGLIGSHQRPVASGLSAVPSRHLR